jgi:restriction endonuclease
MPANSVPSKTPPKARTIVVLDDQKLVLQGYSALFSQRFSSSYNFVMFSSDEDAGAYVRRHRLSILGYIQDLCRPPDVRSSTAGIQFLREIIGVFTPWAKCLVISSISSIPVVKQVFDSHDNVRFLHKYDLPDKLDEDLIWLVAFPDLSAAEEVSARTSEITQFMPAWRGLCTYIVKHQDFLHTMPPSDFELLAGEIFRSFGWQVDFTSRTRDGGYDIVAVRRSRPTDVKILVEAKRYSPIRPVGVDIVRSLYGVKQSTSASKLVLVTSSRVSFDAKREFENVVPWELDFIERDKILKWCDENSTISLTGSFHD